MLACTRGQRDQRSFISVTLGGVIIVTTSVALGAAS
jgi:hypothetical protein